MSGEYDWMFGSSDSWNKSYTPPEPSYGSYDQAEMAKLMRQEDLANAGLQALGGIGGGSDAVSGILNALLGSAKDLGKGLMSPRGIVGLLGMLYGRNNTRPDYGGGEPVNIYPKKITRTIVPSKYGSVAQYAADGGLMQAYATGGVVTGTHKNPLQMEDGGFVMTADAVKGAGGPQGLAQYIPQSEFIVGKGTGKSDDIPATIGGTTPARVSNGEAYIPKAAVKQAGGAPALYALMNQLQRRA